MTMRRVASTLLACALGCAAQEAQGPAGTAAALMLPAGTKVPLRLTNPLGSNTARQGDTVRAEVAFPVTTSNAVAIPAGTYVEGTIDQVTRRGRHAGFAMHFVKMVFSNGYTVTLAAAAADTRTAAVQPAAPAGGVPAGPVAQSANALQATTTVTPPAPPEPGKAAVIGIGVGAAAAMVVTFVALAHRGAPVYLKTGWKFEMTLGDALSLDAAKVAAAVAAQTAH